jgi:thiamine kinase-like enzyme/choline kinase/predicted transcriptional regulator
VDKYYKILYVLNQSGFKSQRDLAKKIEVSVGRANYLLKSMELEGYLTKKEEKRRNNYEMTEKGKQFLETAAANYREEKLSLGENGRRKVKTAVILAAGFNNNFEVPVGLLKIEEIPIIEYIIRSLTNAGIEKIFIVVGHQKEMYERYFGKRHITLVENPRYKWTGTMASLAVLKNDLKEDFILVDSNQIYEESAISSMLEAQYDNCMLLVSPSDSDDEAYVELDKDGAIFKISKDMKQLNKIDAELLGMYKISHLLFEKMLEYYSENENPFLNCEYAIEAIGRIYNIYGVMVDDLVWCLIETPEHYRKAKNIIFSKIKKRVILKRENNAKEVLKAELQLEDKDIGSLKIGGGMTNSNFFVEIKGKKYILRIPGACTEVMISRENEKHNGEIGVQLGLNPPVYYCNAQSGVKVVEYIKGAETLNGKTARLEHNMKGTTSILRKLHESKVELYSHFNVFKEYKKYKELIKKAGGEYYEGFEEIETFFYKLEDELHRTGLQIAPCHNDLVPENFVKNDEGRMYLIDWEYSGFNDPMWDLAAHLLECDFSSTEEELFLSYYFDNGISKENKQKILIFKICQDVLWSAWTIAKEAKGEDFGSYGQERYKRAKELRKTYEEIYGGIEREKQH